MATHQTDFREYVRGAIPGDWSQRHATDPIRAIVEGFPWDGATRNYLQLSALAPVSTAHYYTACWDAPDADTGLGNQEILVLMQLKGATTRGLAMRVSGSAGSENAYIICFNGGWTRLLLRKIVAGVESVLTFATGLSFAENDWVWIRAQCTGTTIRARAWKPGDVWPTSAGPEPTSWTVTTTDSALSTGSVGVSLNLQTSADPSPPICYFAVGTNGAAAPEMSTLPRGMEVWARDPELKADSYLELESKLRSTGATVRWYASKLGSTTAPTDFPASVGVPATLLEGSIPSFSLVEDQLFNDSPDAEAGAKFVLRNTRGLYDSFDSYIFAGCRAVLRVGEQGGALRRYEPVWSGLIDGEPVVNGERVTIDAKLGAPIKDDIVNRTFVGIPTCVEQINKITQSVATATTFDFRSFTLCGRFKGSAASVTGASFGLFFQRSTSTTASQFRCYIHDGDAASSLGGKIGADLSAAGVAKGFTEPVTGASVTGTNWWDGKWHWIAMSVMESGRSFVMIDGAVVLELAASGVVDLPATSVYVGSNTKSALHCDYRMYNTALSEDECRSVMAARSDLDGRIICMWRMDDNAGAAVTDYSSNAKHLAISGTINVDYRWQASDLGSPGLEGQPIPVSLGKVYNAECIYHDAVRFRFLCHDGLGGSRCTLESLKARGTVLVQTTDYTDVGPTNGQVFDMVAAQDTPVTVDLNPETSPQQYFDLPTIASSLVIRQGWSTDKVGAGPVVGAGSTIFETLAGLTPFTGGWIWNDPPPVGDALQQLLSGCAATLAVDRSGRLYPAIVLPPVKPTPYEPAGVDAYVHRCLEFMTDKRGGVYADNDCGSPSGVTSFAFAFWMKIHATGHRIEDGTDATVSPYTGSPVAMCTNTQSALADGWFCGFDRDEFFVYIAGLTPSTFAIPSKSYFKPGLWYYCLVARNSATNKVQLYVGRPQGSTMAKLIDTTTTGSYTGTTAPLVLGGGIGRGFWGSIHQFSFYTAAKVDTDVLADLSAPPPTSRTNIKCLFRLDEGEGDVANDLINTGGSGSRLHQAIIRGCRWAPRLSFDLRKQSFPKLDGKRALRPAWRVDVGYKKNFRPLSGAEIAAGVAQASRPPLLGPGLSAPAISDQRTKYPDSRALRIDSPLALQSEAARLAATLLSRFSTERVIASLSGLRRQALLLQPGDEVAVIDDRFFAAWKAGRVIILKGLSLSKLSANIDFWG